jgi:hypothetical protein
MHHFADAKTMPSRLNRRVPPSPGQTRCAPVGKPGRRACARIKFVLKYQDVVMEATTRIELVYTVLQSGSAEL